MKLHTQEFKEEIIKHGRQLDSVISYTENNEMIVLRDELNSITPHYESSILKSAMKSLEFDCRVTIPIGTVVNFRQGLLVGNAYEYLNFGNYVIYKVEKQEDKESYLITCYDKMLYSMIDYEPLEITYPITIRNYINAICNKLGLVFKNINDTFANYDKQIQADLYEGLGYTYRDILDELAEVTGSTICIDEETDLLEVRYITDTHDTIDEKYFKDTNVNFGEKYGPINSIVLSRSAESDNVYLSDDQSIEQNGLCEIKIKDNQIMNFNDRSNYLPDLLSTLGGLEYYLNDYVSKGILYYNLCDKYTAKIGDNYYTCVMFNNETLINNGLEENVNTPLPEASETDYTKADKTDQRINQTYLIVDKQNQRIDSVITNVTEQNNKISQITQTVDEINSKISDIADITISGESNFASFELDNINESEPIMVKIHPTVRNISYIYPSPNLYPSNNLFSPSRKIRFHNKDTNEDFDYELPDDLLIYDENTYDEFYLNYDSQTCQVIKRCRYNASSDVLPLGSEVTTDYPYPSIELTDGDYIISLPSYEYGYLFARLMVQNIYTTQFATKAEVSSQISQTSQSINLSVDQKLTSYSTTTQMNSAITLKANEITSSVSETYATKTTTNQLSSRINQSARSIELTTTDNNTSAGITIKLKNEDGTQIDEQSGNITMTGLVKFTDLSTSGSTTINGANITTGTLSASKITTGTLNGNNVTITNLNASNIKSGTLTSRAINNGNGTFSVSANGTIHAQSGTIGGWSLSSSKLYGTYNNTRYAIRPYGVDDETNGRSIGWGSLISSSDERLKNNIKNIEDKYNQFYDDLKPVSFKFNEGIDNGNLHFGFIAQDVLKSEKLVNENLSMIEQTDKYYNLYKQEIIALNTWQIQMLKEEVRLLKEEINKLKEKK